MDMSTLSVDAKRTSWAMLLMLHTSWLALLGKCMCVYVCVCVCVLFCMQPMLTALAYEVEDAQQFTLRESLLHVSV